MYNFIGAVPPAAEVLANADAKLHVYGKGPRPNRKVGHVTLRAGSAEELAEKLPDWDRMFERRAVEPGA
jgi:5-(carboxyamino)imidazole ribonucleotide synthase